MVALINWLIILLALSIAFAGWYVGYSIQVDHDALISVRVPDSLLIRGDQAVTTIEKAAELLNAQVTLVNVALQMTGDTMAGLQDAIQSGSQLFKRTVEKSARVFDWGVYVVALLSLLSFLVLFYILVMLWRSGVYREAAKWMKKRSEKRNEGKRQAMEFEIRRKGE